MNDPVKLTEELGLQHKGCRVAYNRGQTSFEGRLVGYFPGTTMKYVDWLVACDGDHIIPYGWEYFGDPEPAHKCFGVGDIVTLLCNHEGVDGSKFNKPQGTDFPHECPKCSGPAYVSIFSVECKANCAGGNR